jgi:hypothetical protein
MAPGGARAQDAATLQWAAALADAALCACVYGCGESDGDPAGGVAAVAGEGNVLGSGGAAASGPADTAALAGFGHGLIGLLVEGLKE